MLPKPIIKLIFHLLYYQMAWTYDWVAWFVSLGQWASWRRLSLNFFQPGPTLELAYGTGGFFVDMLQQGQQPVGIDLSPYMARLTRHRLQRHDYSYRICQAQAQQLPFPDQHFVNIVATFPTDYILQPETLTEVRRVLRDEGRLIVVFMGLLKGPWPVRPFIEWLYQITGQRDQDFPAPDSLLNNQLFSAEWRKVEQDGAAAYLLIARKITVD